MNNIRKYNRIKKTEPKGSHILCPNCHTQTETFTNRQKKKHKRNRYLQRYKSGQVA